MAAKDNIYDNNGGPIHQGAAVSPLHSEEFLFPPVEDCCEITVACFRADYSASRIARAIEDCDTHLLNMNITSCPLESGEMTVLLRIGLRNPLTAIRSLERYGYTVTAVHTPSAEQQVTETAIARISELMAHLNV